MNVSPEFGSLGSRAQIRFASSPGSLIKTSAVPSRCCKDPMGISCSSPWKPSTQLSAESSVLGRPNSAPTVQISCDSRFTAPCERTDNGASSVAALSWERAAGKREPNDSETFTVAALSLERAVDVVAHKKPGP